MNRPFLYAVAAVLILIGAVLLFIGLAFLIAATKQPGRLLPALAMLGCGGALVIWSATKIRALGAAAPENVHARVCELAATSGGELTVAEAMGNLGITEGVARQTLRHLTSGGTCRQEVRGSTEYFIFAGLKQAIKVKKCAYCGTVYPVATPGRQCAGCGGQLEVVDQD
jgi:hypothetical protein